MSNKLLAGSAALVASLVAAPVSSDPVTSDAQSAEHTVAGACQNCHGPGGNSVSPTFPRLNGQQADYIAAQLKAFRDHTRADPHAQAYMWGMAAALDDALIAELAKYYAAQPATQPQSVGAL